jgi:putative acetyltransferase
MELCLLRIGTGFFTVSLSVGCGQQSAFGFRLKVLKKLKCCRTINVEKAYENEMTGKLEIRQSQRDDAGDIEQLYVDAFPEEDLTGLVRELLDFGESVLSLVGIHDNKIAGHISFTFCHVERNEQKVALLAPLAVTPTLHKQGIGSALVKSGFKHVENARIGHVFVLGDPAYYSRFGFMAEDTVTTPYPLPAEWHGAWQSIQLFETKALHDGRLSVPAPWQDAALWTS